MAETSLTLLERLRQRPDTEAWRRLMDLYAPLIGRWLARWSLQPADHDDLMQEVSSVVVRKLADFQRQREGSFRAWLRLITANCLREHWRRSQRQPLGTGDSNFLQKLQELEDPQSPLAQLWNDEHDRHVAHRLLAAVEQQFEPTTREAFRRVVMLGEKPEAVAAELGITVNAVFLAKSRILRRLRCESDGLLS